MAQFFETRMGMRFFEADVPRALKALEGLQKAVEQLVKATELKPPREPEPEKKCGENVCCDDPDCAEREDKEEARSIAKQNYESDDIKVEPGAEVHLVMEDDGNVTGAWVEAYVWVEFTANTREADRKADRERGRKANEAFGAGEETE